MLYDDGYSHMNMSSVQVPIKGRRRKIMYRSKKISDSDSNEKNISISKRKQKSQDETYII